MSYTRFDLKRKKGKAKYLASFMVILVLAIGLATMLFKILYINTQKTDSDKISKSNTSKDSQIQSSSNNKFVIIQGGVYVIKANVDAEKKLLEAYAIPFSVEEENKTRVFSGIYKEETGEKFAKVLTDSKIDNAKITYIINNKDLCDSEIVEILNAQIKVLSKLCEKDVKSVNTDELKKWASDLKNIDNRPQNAKMLNSLKEYINKYPKELTKDKVSENYAYMYSIISKIGQKQK